MASWTPAGPSTPAALRRVKIREKTKLAECLVVDSLPGLIGLVQMDILEIHTWNSVVDDLERPNRVVFDLDPGPDVEWGRVVEAARRVRARLRAVGLESFVKTTGGRGLHVVAPLHPGPTWGEGGLFARAIGEALEQQHPRDFVVNTAKAKRKGKIFVDWLRNVRGATTVAAYSTRAKPGAPVSAPIAWEELSPRLRSDQFTVANLAQRLSGLAADPWASYWSARQRLPKA